MNCVSWARLAYARKVGEPLYKFCYTENFEGNAGKLFVEICHTENFEANAGKLFVELFYTKKTERGFL